LGAIYPGPIRKHPGERKITIFSFPLLSFPASPTMEQGPFVLISLYGVGEEQNLYVIPEVDRETLRHLKALEHVNCEDFENWPEMPSTEEAQQRETAYYCISSLVGFLGEVDLNLFDWIENKEKYKKMFGQWDQYRVDSYKEVNDACDGIIRGVFCINYCDV
jgi:hypothetical protein